MEKRRTRRRYTKKKKYGGQRYQMKHMTNMVTLRKHVSNLANKSRNAAQKLQNKMKELQ